jgi:uncharacterized protein (TIGR00255 family)
MMTVTSMTGFGRARGALGERLSASVVLRTVNHRSLDVVVRTNVRDEMPELEAAVRTVIGEHFSRGRVTVQVGLDRTGGAGQALRVDAEALLGLLEQIAELRLPETVDDALRLGDLLGLQGVVVASQEETLLDDDALAALAALMGEACREAVAMRRDEGARLLVQIEAELDAVAAFLDWLEPLRESMRERLLERLTSRMRELIDAAGVIEPERLAQEAAIAADRADVAEEVVRLRSHLVHFGERLAAGGSVGRALDFLCQEVHRELNTLGAKCREVGVAERLVDAKTAVERVREQVQNLE